MSSPILQEADGTWFPGSIHPVQFWPYTSHVTGRVLEMAITPALEKLRTTLVELFKQAGVRAEVDNKTVFEIDDVAGRRWCLGFYDNRFTLGTSCRRS